MHRNKDVFCLNYNEFVWYAIRINIFVYYLSDTLIVRHLCVFNKAVVVSEKCYVTTPRGAAGY